jgi:hypothetical protein
MMGMENRSQVEFTLSHVFPKKALKLPAALMYYAFFAIGLFTGTLLTAGSKRGSSGSNKTNRVDR